MKTAAEKMRDVCVDDLRSMGRGYVAHYHDVLNKAAERLAALPLPPDPCDAELERLRAALRGLVGAVDDLISDSGGVYGLHRNGDPAPWSELTEGGQFEEWMGPPLEEARAALKEPEA